MKKIGAETILAAIIAPVVIWFFSFILNTYQVAAQVSDLKDDIKETKTDIKEIKSFLITNGVHK